MSRPDLNPKIQPELHFRISIRIVKILERLTIPVGLEKNLPSCPSRLNSSFSSRRSFSRFLPISVWVSTLSWFIKYPKVTNSSVTRFVTVVDNHSSLMFIWPTDATYGDYISDIVSSGRVVRIRTFVRLYVLRHLFIAIPFFGRQVLKTKHTTSNHILNTERDTVNVWNYAYTI